MGSPGYGSSATWPEDPSPDFNCSLGLNGLDFFFFFLRNFKRKLITATCQNWIVERRATVEFYSLYLNFLVLALTWSVHVQLSYWLPAVTVRHYCSILCTLIHFRCKFNYFLRWRNFYSILLRILLLVLNRHRTVWIMTPFLVSLQSVKISNLPKIVSLWLGGRHVNWH